MTKQGFLKRFIQATCLTAVAAPTIAFACGQVSLKLTKSGPASIKPGETITYLFHIHKEGTGITFSAGIDDKIPAGLTVKSGEISFFPDRDFVPRTCKIEAGNLNCGAMFIAGGTQDLYLRVTFNTDPTLACTTINNKARVTSFEGSSPFTGTVSTVVECLKPEVKVAKSGPAAVTRGDIIFYQVTATNTGNTAATDVLIRDAVPQSVTFLPGSSDPTCSLPLPAGNTVLCNIGTLAAGASRTVTIAFQTQDIANCTTTTITNTATVSWSNAIGTFPLPQSNTVVTQLNCKPQIGCIDVIKQVFDSNGNPIQTVPQFTFTLDGSRTGVNSSAGNLRFTDVVPGSHTVAETLPPGWQVQSVNPLNGNVIVQSGNNCAQVIFQNRQTPPPVGCIDIIKKALDANGNQFSTVPAFTFRLDGNVAGTNNSAGNLRINNVSVGSHIVDEIVLAGWTLQSGGGNVNVVSGGSCAQMTFVNKQVPPPKGCVEIVKQVYDPNGNQILTVPQFTFTLDGNRTGVNDSTGNLKFADVTPGQHVVVETLPAGWTQELVFPANGQLNVQAGNVCAQAVFRNRQLPPPPPELGCIEVVKKVFDPDGIQIPTVPQFTFSLDGVRTGVNNSAGNLQFNSVTVGSHTISESLPPGWQMQSVSPANGTVTVTSGNVCAKVTFENKQLPPPPVKGCIEVTKQAYDDDGHVLTTVPQFSFVLDGTSTFTNASNGKVRLNDIAVGAHTVTETVPQGWTLEQVEPANGQVTVVAGNQCAQLVFRNKQNPTPPVTGCIEITKSAVESNGSAITPVPQFTFRLDGTIIGSNNTSGVLRINNLSVGQHTVSEIVPQGWQLLSPVSNNETVNVVAGTTCSQLSFQNKKLPPPPNIGCIDVVKQAFDSNNNQLASVPAFTFTLDGTTTGVNSASGSLRFSNIPAGTHSIAEAVLQGWTLQQMTPANGQVVVQAGDQCAQMIFKNKQNPPPPPVVGCIEITKQALDQSGNVLTNVPQFSFTMDGTRVIVNDGAGRARLDNVSVGSHTVVENVLAGWTLEQITPSNGQVSVLAGNQCAQMTFRNRQNPPPAGCIEVRKHAYNPQEQNISTVPAFTFNLDNTRTGANNSNGILIFNNVSVGQHIVSEVVPSGWMLTGVTPENGLVSVQAGNNCAVVDFINKQLPPPPPVVGCIDITKQALDSNGNVLSSIPQFSFKLDNNAITFNTSDGKARYNNVSVGAHTVSEIVPQGWNLELVSPANGQVNVVGGNNCAQVTFRNKQIPVAPVNGCIDVVKQVFDASGNQLFTVPSFTFTLDGTRTGVNASDGKLRFSDVPVGTHTVIETALNGWTLQSVIPASGTVQVQPGACTTVIFNNKQLPAGIDFSISKTDNETEVEPGDDLTYEITVRNNSNQTVNNVTVTDTLPQDVNFESASENGSLNGRIITWSNLTFAGLQTRTFTVRVEVDEDADCGTLRNRASVFDKTATDETDIDECVDSDEDDDDEDEDEEVSISKEANTSEVFPGGIIEYTVRVKNTGDADLEDLELTDHLPYGITVIDDGDADGNGSNTLTWDIDSLDEGESWTVKYRVSVNSNMLPGSILRNEACVEGDDVDEECEMTTVGVIGNLPQTGFDLPRTPLQFKPIHRSEPLSAALSSIISIIGLAAGMGITALKKFSF
jgi:uncharacterized repeat protein (TIGR01451 family)